MAIDYKAIRRAMMVAKDIAASVSSVPLERADGGSARGRIAPEQRVQNLANFMEGAHPEFLNEDGSARVFYHATPKNFKVFKPGGLQHQQEMSGPAIYMTRNPKVQNAAHNIIDYSSGDKEFKTGTNVMPLHANIKNPLIITKDNYKQLRQRYPDMGFGAYILSPEVKKDLEERGYDGIINKWTTEDDPESQEFMAFYPWQVKSAIGNRGTFDRREDDITKAKGGEVDPDLKIAQSLGADTSSIPEIRKAGELNKFRQSMQEDVQSRAQRMAKLGQKYHESGLLPHPVGTLLQSPDSRQKNLPPMKVMGHYVDSKNPDRYGYFVNQGDTNGIALVSDPVADERIRKTNPSWDRQEYWDQTQPLQGPQGFAKAEGGDVEADSQEQWPHPVPKENMLKTHHAQRYGAGLPNNIVPENMFDRDENPGISHGTGPYLYALEHIGDLPHRLSYIDDVGGGVGYGIEAALDKTARNYDLRPERLNESLQRNYNFQKRENSFHGSYDDFVKKFEDAADRYAHAYRMIPVHTQLQELGRDAAIALGERDFYTARKNLNEIHRRLSGDNPEQEYWRPVKNLEASNSIAKNTARLERMRRVNGGDVDVKAPVIDPAKAIRRAKMVAKSIGGSNSESEQTEITPSHSETRTEAGKLQQPGAVRGGSGVLQASLQADPAAPLTDFPADIAIPATGQIIKAGPNPLIRQVAGEYMRSMGRPYRPATAYAKVSPPRATRIAKAYEEMKHDPQDPLVKASYNQMLKETMAQYEAAKAAGFKAEFWNPETDEDPYGPSPRLAIEDVNKNHHMFVFPTRAGFGSDEEMAAELHQNPLLADSGERWNGQPVTYNDIFRAVHDYYGHAKEGVGFRADGEENAWRSHAAMYSPLARLAMTSETRGQNSWVNYGPHGEHNRKARTEDTIFADQKNGILPAWVMHEGAEDFLHPDDVLETYKIYNRKHRADGGSLMDDDQPTTLKDPDLFDMSMLHETPKVAQFDLPRYMPARGVPERVADITKSRKVANKLADVIQSGLDMGGARWYNAEPLRKEFLKYHGQDVGNRMFRKYMDMVAATSPRSEVSQNVRNASYYYQRLASGQPVPEVGEKNPQPYGHLAQRLHQLNAQRVAGAGWDPLNNPKPASFAENLTGNQSPVTVDTHAFRLPSILAEDPRFIETAYKPSKEAPPQNIRKMVESGELSLKDALKTPAYWNAAPKETEYAAMEQMYKKAAQKLGITPAAAQAAAWVGGGKLTGLASDESKPFMQFVQDRIYKTAREKNMDPQDVLQKFVKGEMSLYSDGGAVDAALNIAKKARKE